MGERKWKVAEAKARLSELLQEAQRRPQVIENRDREVAIVLGIAEYRELEALRAGAAPAARLSGFLRFSEEARSAGGGELVTRKRRSRRSPFSAAPR
jgi:prevent-host-death family protein